MAQISATLTLIKTWSGSGSFCPSNSSSSSLSRSYGSYSKRISLRPFRSIVGILCSLAKLMRSEDRTGKEKEKETEGEEKITQSASAWPNHAYASRTVVRTRVGNLRRE